MSERSQETPTLSGTGSAGAALKKLIGWQVRVSRVSGQPLNGTLADVLADAIVLRHKPIPPEPAVEGLVFLHAIEEVSPIPPAPADARANPV